jgi:hypothetical protein
MIRERIEIDLKPYKKFIKSQYPFLTEIEVKDLTVELYNFLEIRYSLEVETITN